MAAKFACAQWPWGVETKEQFIQSCKDMSEVGYEYFESVKTFIDTFKDNPVEFKSICNDYNMHPISFYFHLTCDRQADIEELKRKIDFVADNGIKTICVQAGGFQPGAVAKPATEDELRDTLETINEYGRICRPYDILPCVHPHHNTKVWYENEIDFIMQNTDPDFIGFGPDTAHLTAGNCNAGEIFERYKDRIHFVHLKDLHGVIDSSGFEYGVEVYGNFREMGEGEVDFKPVFKALKSVNYDGYLTCELDKTRFTNKESARMNLEYLKKYY